MLCGGAAVAPPRVGASVMVCMISSVAVLDADLMGEGSTPDVLSGYHKLLNFSYPPKTGTQWSLDCEMASSPRSG